MLRESKNSFKGFFAWSNHTTLGIIGQIIFRGRGD